MTPHCLEAPHVRVGRVPIFDGDADDAVGLLARALAEGAGARVATANLDFLALARRDERLLSLLERSSIVIADGAPVAWLARARGGSRVRRLAGVDLVDALLSRAAGPRPLRVVLYGSTPEISAGAAEALARRHPSVVIAGSICPPFRDLSDGERDAELGTFRKLAPDVVLVALGCPKQEQLIARSYDAAPGAVWIGIGGTLDFYSGRRRRAPRWMQRCGLEWSVRLAQEPGRLWRRYLLRDIPALAALLAATLGERAELRARRSQA